MNVRRKRDTITAHKRVYVMADGNANANSVASIGSTRAKTREMFGGSVISGTVKRRVLKPFEPAVILVGRC
jgi:hypothetical protein